MVGGIGWNFSKEKILNKINLIYIVSENKQKKIFKSVFPIPLNYVQILTRL